MISDFCEKHSIRQKDFKAKLIAIGLLRDAGYKNRLEIVGIGSLVMKYNRTNRSGSFQYREDAMKWIFSGKESEEELRVRVQRMKQRYIEREDAAYRTIRESQPITIYQTFKGETP